MLFTNWIDESDFYIPINLELSAKYFSGWEVSDWLLTDFFNTFLFESSFEF